MRVFLDTNVLLDVYLNRAGEPGSARVIAACGEPWNQAAVVDRIARNALGKPDQADEIRRHGAGK